jgi:hypothetical protein
MLLLIWGALSDERTYLSSTIADGARQRSHFRVLVLRGSLLYFSVSSLIFPQPEGPDPRIYISQEQGGPVMPPSTLTLTLSKTYTKSVHNQSKSKLYYD